MPNLNAILEKDKKRYYALRKIYEESDKPGINLFHMVYFTEEEGWAEQEMEDAYNYLIGEDLVKPFSLGYGVIITHRGRMEVEQSIKYPNTPTQHFQLPVIQQVTQNFYHSQVGAVQTGNQNVANVSQEMGERASELLHLLGRAREDVQTLSEEDRNTALDYIDVIEETLNNEGPENPRLKSFGRALIPFLQQAAAGATVEGIKALIGI